MKLAMQKVTVVGKINGLKKSISALKKSGVFQIVSTSQVSKAEIKREDELAGYPAFIQRITTAMGIAKNAEKNITNYKKKNKKAVIENEKPFADKDVWGEKPMMTYDKFQETKEKQNKVEELIGALEAHQVAYNTCVMDYQSAKKEIAAIRPFISFPLPMNQVKSSAHIYAVAGVISDKQLEKYQAEVSASSEIVVQSEPSPKKGSSYIVVASHIKNKEEASKIEQYGLSKITFSFDTTVVKRIADLQTHMVDLERKRVSLLNEMILNAEEIRLLKCFHDYLVDALDTHDLSAQTQTTPTCFIINGWATKRDSEAVVSVLKAVDKEVIVNFEEPAKGENPPTLTKNSVLVEPYGAITGMYGQPGKTDMDPNPFVAFFYFLFFGVFLGDVGYGLLMFAITFFMIMRAKKKGKPKNLLIRVFCIGAISSIIWGFVFNSFFGGFGSQYGENSTLKFFNEAPIDPIYHATFYLALSLFLGIIQLAVGFFLSFVNNLKQNRKGDAWLGALPRFIMFIGLMLFFPSLSLGLLKFQDPKWAVDGINFIAPYLQTPAMIFLLVGLAGTLLFNGRNAKGIMGKVTGVMGGAYGLLNFFSDILSYARLFGIGIAGAVIGMLANTLGGIFGTSLFGIVIGLVVTVVFHGFNLGLGMLSTYVHNARLQFIEFFSKFYTGDGTAFVPVGSKMKYTRIIPSV
ncbi:MAG: hypothetical protein LBM01_01065 [Christensenellaceae bacterium]|jgi:V/A-type H+-transporting ATPase subunit I|nr:hypothetical protein [Christensenellaceae bacterium]